MERGKLDFTYAVATVFVFDGLIAELNSPRLYAADKLLGRWRQSLNYWDFNQHALDRMYELMSRFNVPVEVITWQPPQFAEVLNDRLWELKVPVRGTRSTSYPVASSSLAIDDDVNTVYDADPTHRFGYGFKGRELI